MRFRFVLSHAESSTSLEITEPDGWRDCTLKLDRHEEFHSLIEHFDGSFIFYGNNGVVNGGIEYIKDIIRDYGIDTTVLIDIDFTYDEVTYSEIFQGQLSLVDSEEMPKNKMRIPIIRDDRWAKFISRLDTPVNLQSDTDLDDNLVTSGRIDLKLTPQKIKAKYLANFLVGVFYDDPGNDFLDEYIQITPTDSVLDEIEEAFILLNTTNPELPVWNFEMLYSGEYVFSLRIEASDHTVIGAGGLTLDGKAKLFFQINNQTPIEFTLANHSSVEDSTSFTYQATHLLLAGDIIRIYGLCNAVLNGRFYIWGVDNPEVDNDPPSGVSDPSFWDIIAYTTFPESKAECFLIHDAAGHIIDRITGEHGIFYSELLGSQSTQYRQYPSPGCAWAYALIKGLQLRGYTLNEKKFFMSFMQWWRGVNPILNLSLCYETVQIPHLVDVSPDVNLIEPLANWSNAPGAGWDFATFGHPFVSVNGSGGLEGYTVGEAVFNEDQPYEFDINIFIQNTSPDVPNAIITFAILDAGYGELATRDFNHVGAGDHPETFILIPTGVGAYFAVRIENNTPVATKNFEVTLAFTEDAPIEYTTETVIRIEDKAYQYDDSGTSIDFSYIEDITKKYDNDRIFNKVSIGYTNWESEDISGIDDPQTKKTYNSRFKKVGKNFELYSEFIAASLLAEQARRTTIIKSADYKHDNSTFIIALNEVPQDESPDISPDIITFIPELDENFSSIENLESPETRYNLKLTPARNFLRWQNFLQGPLQDYIGSEWRFSSAEGNYHMSATLEANGCDEDYEGFDLAEDANILVDDDFLHLPDLYEATIPMDWNDYALIRDNRRKPIGISKSDTGHARMFIKTLSFQPMHGEAKVLMWAKDYLDLGVLEDTTPMQECIGASNVGGGGGAEDCENGIFDENGFYLTDEFGECITEDEPGAVGLALDFALDGAF